MTHFSGFLVTKKMKDLWFSIKKISIKLTSWLIEAAMGNAAAAAVQEMAFSRHSQRWNSFTKTSRSTKSKMKRNRKNNLIILYISLSSLPWWITSMNAKGSRTSWTSLSTKIQTTSYRFNTSETSSVYFWSLPNIGNLRLGIPSFHSYFAQSRWDFNTSMIVKSKRSARLQFKRSGTRWRYFS